MGALLVMGKKEDISALFVSNAPKSSPQPTTDLVEKASESKRKHTKRQLLAQ